MLLLVVQNEGKNFNNFYLNLFFSRFVLVAFDFECNFRAI